MSELCWNADTAELALSQVERRGGLTEGGGRGSRASEGGTAHKAKARIVPVAFRVARFRFILGIDKTVVDSGGFVLCPLSCCCDHVRVVMCSSVVRLPNL